MMIIVTHSWTKQAMTGAGLTDPFTVCVAPQTTLYPSLISELKVNVSYQAPS